MRTSNFIRGVVVLFMVPLACTTSTAPEPDPVWDVQDVHTLDFPGDGPELPGAGGQGGMTVGAGGAGTGASNTGGAGSSAGGAGSGSSSGAGGPPNIASCRDVDGAAFRTPSCAAAFSNPGCGNRVGRGWDRCLDNDRIVEALCVGANGLPTAAGVCVNGAGPGVGQGVSCRAHCIAQGFANGRCSTQAVNNCEGGNDNNVGFCDCFNGGAGGGGGGLVLTTETVTDSEP